MALTQKADELRKLRESLGITQAALAQALGVTQAYISSLEKANRQNDAILEKANEYLLTVVGPGRGEAGFRALKATPLKYSPRTAVHSESAGLLNWSWSSFSKLRDTSDIYDHAMVGTKSVALMVADIVGSGIRGSWQAAQLRFGFHALASALTKYNNNPTAYLGPLGNALQNVKGRQAAPPSIAIVCMDCSAGNITFAALGLPAPTLYIRKKEQLVKQAVQPADLINFGVSAMQVSTLSLDEGDSLIICTDGFYDWLKQSKGISGQVLSTLFTEAAKNFSGDSNNTLSSIIAAKGDSIDSTFTDDATIVVVTRPKGRR